LSEQDLSATEEEIDNNLSRVIDGNQITFGFIVKNTTTSDKNEDKLSIYCVSFE